MIKTQLEITSLIQLPFSLRDVINYQNNKWSTWSLAMDGQPEKPTGKSLLWRKPYLQ